MSTLDHIQKEIADTQAFVRERFDPIRQELLAVREEQERLSANVSALLERQRSVQRAFVLIRAGDRMRVRGGPLDGMDMVDIAIVRSLLAAQQRRPQDYDPRVLRAWEGTVQRAMDSTSAGSGAELVSQEEGRQLWADVNLETAVASLFDSITMPSNPFDIPLQLGDIQWYPGTPNTASTDTALTTAKQTLTAHELVGMVPWAYELDEDAVIAMLSEVRATLLRNAAQVLDDVLLNGDTSTTGNINYDGETLTTAIPGAAHYLVGFDGLIHQPLVDHTAMRNALGAAPAIGMFNQLRRKLGKYGVRPSEQAFVTDVSTFIACQAIEQVQTLDKMGPRATLLTGQLGAVEGVPLIVSEQMRKAGANGKISATTAGTTGRLLLVNRTQWRKGFKRELHIETERDIQKRQNVMVVSMRLAFAERTGARASATHTALQFNITGV